MTSHENQEYRVMSMLKLKINVNLPQLLCIVVSVAQNGEFERFGGFYVDCYYTPSYNVAAKKTDPAAKTCVITLLVSSICSWNANR